VEWVHLTPKSGPSMTLRIMTMNVKVILKQGVLLLGKNSCFLKNNLQYRVNFLVDNCLCEVTKVVNCICFDVF
jgi:hypothetical protein